MTQPNPSALMTDDASTLCQLVDTSVVPSNCANDPLEAAIAYVRRGWAVLPVQPRGKRPLGALVRHGLKDATLDLHTVDRWWRAEPEANVGLVTGITFDVLDVDGEEGVVSINRATPWYGEHWDGQSTDNPTVDGPTSRTGRGWHVLVGVTGFGNKAGLLPHVDWRGRDGYIVAPPSIHETGRRYRWVTGWSPGDQAVRDAPAWLLDLLDTSVGPTVSINDARDQRLAPAGGAYGRRALEIEVGRVALAPPGGRNDQLNKSSYGVGQLIAGGEIEDAAGAVRALIQAGLAVGLTEHEVFCTVRSGIDGGSRCPRRASSRAA